MFSTRLLRFINLSIAVLFALLLAAGYWYAWRPLPDTSGLITAPVSARAAVRRDALGVPHIAAESWEDAIFLQGFVTAQDRMWQMDALRRLAAGELAEVVGSAALESDREARRLRLGRLADEFVRTLAAADRGVLAAYARGVNYYQETHRGRLPLEFAVLGYDPRPWSVRDSILAGLEMHRTLTTSWRDEITKLSMLDKGDRAKVEFLFPARSGGELQPGSNAWAVAGSRAAGGKPILANDTHLEFTLPATWYMVHLQAPGLNVSGFSLPGVPCVIVGHNERIAWGVTNLQFDVQDLYREKFDPQTGRYEYRGQMEQARLERDMLAVKGARPVELLQWITRHGPIFLAENNQFYALRWAAAGPGPFEFPFMELNRARNWSGFIAALARFPGPGQNFVYADADGNIGYQVAGRLPIRKNCAGDLPAEGAAGDCEWEGFIPFDQLPRALNPGAGMIVSANQNPFPENYAFRVSGNFASHYRSRQIRDLLAAREKWRPEEMLAVQKDVYSAFSHFLARQVVAAWDARKAANPALTGALQILRVWNGQMEKGAAAPLLVALIYQQLRKAVAERAAPGKGANYDYQMAPAVLEKLLRERPKNWFADYDQLLMRCFADAVEEGAKIQGSRVSRWDYGRYREMKVAHPVGGRLPLIGRYFNIGPAPMSGSSTTVKQMMGRVGPSMRMVVDLGNLDASLANLTAGQSGQFLSRHYKDQWDAYYSGRSFLMQFRNVEAKSVLVVKP